VTPTSVEQLKELSLDDLMQTEVTSVSRHSESLLDTASAIQVISSQDITRSGATTIPQALQLADNLDIAQKDPHDWGISASIDLAASDEAGEPVVELTAVGPL